MKVAMIASEALPFAKSGGLADVVYSLSRALAAKKQNVSIIMPYYQQMENKQAGKRSFRIDRMQKNFERNRTKG